MEKVLLTQGPGVRSAMYVRSQLSNLEGGTNVDYAPASVFC